MSPNVCRLGTKVGTFEEVPGPDSHVGTSSNGCGGLQPLLDDRLADASLRWTLPVHLSIGVALLLKHRERRSCSIAYSEQHVKLERNIFVATARS